MKYNNRLIQDVGLLLNPDEIITQNASMKEYSTFKAGGNAEYLIIFKSLQSLTGVVNYLSKIKFPYFVLGGGSNVIFKDEGYKGAVLLTKNINGFSLSGDTVTAEAGASVIKLCNFALENSLSGLEFLCSVPGTAGGAVYMNAGAYGCEIGGIVSEVKALSSPAPCGAPLERGIRAKDCGFSYRNSIFKTNGEIILSASLKLCKSDKKLIEEKTNKNKRHRISTQPQGYPNLGSIFKNPEGAYAAKLIDGLSLKGLGVGGAYVSEKHANFIINKNKATASDLISLIEVIKEKVFDEHKIELKEEIVIVG